MSALAEDARPLLGAYAISGTLGALWVLLVLLGPRESALAALPSEADSAPVAVTLAEEPVAEEPPVVAPAPEVPPPSPPRVESGIVQPRAATSRPAPRPVGAASPAPTAQPASSPAADAASAFGGAFAAADPGLAGGDVRRVLGGVKVSGEAASAGTAPGRTALDRGEETRVRTPGRGTLADGAAGRAIGTVTAGGGVARAAVRVEMPRETGSTSAASGPRGDVAQLGTAARGRESQLRFCYVESGLRADPALAGSVTVAVTLAAGGRVTGAEIKSRSWSGEGAAAAEACILQKVRGWQLPSRGAGGTYDFSFSFTR